MWWDMSQGLKILFALMDVIHSPVNIKKGDVGPDPHDDSKMSFTEIGLKSWRSNSPS